MLDWSRNQIRSTKETPQNDGEEWEKIFATGIWYSGTVAAQTYLWKLEAAMQLDFREEKDSYPPQEHFIVFLLNQNYKNCNLANCVFIVNIHTRIMVLTCLSL